jgi:hypothetical protein
MRSHRVIAILCVYLIFLGTTITFGTLVTTHINQTHLQTNPRKLEVNAHPVDQTNPSNNITNQTHQQDD